MKVVIVSFFIYSFGGWLWESIILPICKREPIVNSGFLSGPVVPIYGFGAILVVLLFNQGKQYRAYEIFVYGGVAACILEYLTSYVMEKIFHRRWWDYSNLPLHYHGRICFFGFLIFGIFSLGAVHYIQPFLTNIIDEINNSLVFVLVIVLLLLFISDIIFTTRGAYHLEVHIKEIAKLIGKEKTRTHREENIKIKEIISHRKELKRYQRRLLKAYPYLIKREYRKRKEEKMFRK